MWALAPFQNDSARGNCYISILIYDEMRSKHEAIQKVYTGKDFTPA